MRAMSAWRRLGRAGAMAAGLTAATAGGCVADPAEVLEERNQLQLHTANAQMYLEKGDLARAQQQAERALDIDDAHSKARLILGNVRFLMAQRLVLPKDDAAAIAATEATRLELIEQAEADLLAVANEAAESDVAVFKAYYVLGDLHFWRHQRALRESVRLERAGRPKSEWSPVQDEADRLLDLAVRHYQNALHTSHERFDAARARLVETLYDRGRKHPRGRDYEAALRHAGLYIDKAVTDQEVLRERIAQEIPKQRDLSEQQRTLAVQLAQERLKELADNVIRMRQQRARLHAKRGEWEPAAAELAQAITEDPDNSLLYFEYGLALAQCGDLPQAHAQLARFAELRRTGRDRLVAEAQRLIAERAPNWQERVQPVEARIRECDADQVRVALDLALLDCRLGRYGDARAQLDQLLRRDPESVAASLLGAVAALETEDREAAGAALERFDALVGRRHPALVDVLQFSKALREHLTTR
jgi:tetratricopeptide (TPR) repeat protein